MRCTKCGQEINGDAKYCPVCGAAVTEGTGSSRDSYSEYGGSGYSASGSYSGENGSSSGYGGSGYSASGSYSGGYSSSSRYSGRDTDAGRERPPHQDSYYSRRQMTIDDLPDDLKPMSAWGYVGWGILFAIPIVGLVLVIVFSCISGNINRKRFARSYICWFIIAAIIFAILFITGILTWNGLINGRYFRFNP